MPTQLLWFFYKSGLISVRPHYSAMMQLGCLPLLRLFMQRNSYIVPIHFDMFDLSLYCSTYQSNERSPVMAVAGVGIARPLERTAINQYE